jgi:hypothetical protein
MMDDDEFEAVGGMIGWENRNTPRGPAPVSFCHWEKVTWQKNTVTKQMTASGQVVRVPGYRCDVLSFL